MSLAATTPSQATTDQLLPLVSAPYGRKGHRAWRSVSGWSLRHFFATARFDSLAAASRPSIRAAIIMIPASVETPVPPIPAMKILHRSSMVASGAGISISLGNAGKGMTAGAESPGTTLTKLGQNPSKHDMSLLHRLWSICLFSPSAVITGLTATQLDWVAQSPHPSHTA